jgi:hypothetical protein
MLKFKEYLDNEDVDGDVDEAISAQTRMKMKANARKNASKMKAGRARAEKKIASPEKLKDRAKKQARTAIEKKILKNKSKADLSFSSREALEKKVAKKGAAINRLAKKLLPQIKQAERAKHKDQEKEEK